MNNSISKPNHNIAQYNKYHPFVTNINTQPENFNRN